MPDIKQLSENGTQFYPETHVTAVIDGNGASVDTLLSGKQNTLVSGTNIKTINNTSLLGSGNISITSSSGTVTSVKMTVPTGLSVSGSPVTSSGTLAVSLASGYTIPTTTEMNGKEVTTNKVTSLSSSSTDTQYPSAKCVHTALTSFPKYAHLENESEMPVSPASDTMYLIDSDTSAQYAKYRLCANMTEYNNIANKDSQTLYLIPKTT